MGDSAFDLGESTNMALGYPLLAPTPPRGDEIGGCTSGRGPKGPPGCGTESVPVDTPPPGVGTECVPVRKYGLATALSMARGVNAPFLESPVIGGTTRGGETDVRTEPQESVRCLGLRRLPVAVLRSTTATGVGAAILAAEPMASPSAGVVRCHMCA